jgi:hypothetical protein
MNKFQEIMKIADIHVARIQSAIHNIGHLFPINATKLKALTENELVWIDLLIHRFGKLQDLIGAKLINIFLEAQIEDINGLTMLDKVNKLERLNIIENTQLWKNMREVRNHIAHEYPDHPEIMVRYINQIFELTPKLLEILHNIAAKMKTN